MAKPQSRYKKEIDFRQIAPSVFFIVFGTIVCILVLIQYSHTNSKNIFTTKAALPPIPATSVTPQLSTETIVTLSPDGTWRLTMKKQVVRETFYYTFLTLDSSNKERQVFTKTVDTIQSLTVPYNTWSPDNKYFFLKESRPTGNSYYVFNSDGSSFSDNSQYIDVGRLFQSKVTDYSLEEITGWADPNLLIINTKTKEGEVGPSFWFEISSQSFIQLSTHFG